MLYSTTSLGLELCSSTRQLLCTIVKQNSGGQSSQCDCLIASLYLSIQQLKVRDWRVIVTPDLQCNSKWQSFPFFFVLPGYTYSPQDKHLLSSQDKHLQCMSSVCKLEIRHVNSCLFKASRWCFYVFIIYPFCLRSFLQFNIFFNYLLSQWFARILLIQLRFGSKSIKEKKNPNSQMSL